MNVPTRVFEVIAIVDSHRPAPQPERALGMALEDIKRSLDTPHFDRQEHRRIRSGIDHLVGHRNPRQYSALASGAWTLLPAPATLTGEVGKSALDHRVSGRGGGPRCAPPLLPEQRTPREIR